MTADSIQFAAAILLMVVLVSIVGYLFWLRHDFYVACRESGNLELYAECPMGLPVGTIRSTLALVIILFAVGYIAISEGSSFPQQLTAIVGTVLGFYFGDRSARQSQKTLTTQLERLQSTTEAGAPAPSPSQPADTQSASSAPSPSESTEKASQASTPPPGTEKEVASLLSQIEDRLAVTRVASQVLPRSFRQRFSPLTKALDQGVDTVRGLLNAGDLVSARKNGEELLSRFKKENPVRVLLERAQRSFPSVLEAAVEPFPLVGTLVNVATSVKEQVYDRWKARILHQPFAPADLPLDRVDANTGFTLLVETPTMKEAFRSELEANDRPFLEDTAEELLSTGDLESIWSNYSDRFESRQQFEDGLTDLRRSAADLELKEEIDASLFEPVGGYDAATGAVDALHSDEDAEADLDALVTVFDALRSADELNTPVRTLFAEMRAELTPSSASSAS